MTRSSPNCSCGARTDHEGARSPKAQAITPESRPAEVDLDHRGPRLKDLPTYLETGKSPKYDSEKILGRWNFNVNVAMSLFRRAKPNISSKEMQNWKRWMVAAFAKTSFVAMTDHQAILKNVPQLRLPAAGAAPSAGPQTLKGQWKSSGWQVSTYPFGRSQRRATDGHDRRRPPDDRGGRDGPGVRPGGLVPLVSSRREE